MFRNPLVAEKMRKEVGMDRLEIYNYPKQEEIDPDNPDAGNTDRSLMRKVMVIPKLPQTIFGQTPDLIEEWHKKKRATSQLRNYPVRVFSPTPMPKSELGHYKIEI
jgi:hypothetical protein